MAKGPGWVRVRLADQVGADGKVWTTGRDETTIFHIKCRLCWEEPPHARFTGAHPVIQASTGEEAWIRWRDHARSCPRDAPREATHG